MPEKILEDEFSLKAKDTFIEKVERFLVKRVGSWSFLVVNLIWFAVWIYYDWNFEKLTFWVSLEAIVLAVLILINANKEIEHDRERAIKDYKIDATVAKRVKEIEKDLTEIKSRLK